MSDKDLRDTISAAEERLSHQEAAVNKMHGRRTKQANPRVVILTVLALISCGVSFAMLINAGTEVQEDILAAELDFLMEADAEIYAYYDLFEQLPSEMPDYAIRNFVGYRRIDDNNFQLISLLSSDVVIERNITTTVDPEQVRLLLAESSD